MDVRWQGKYFYSRVSGVNGSKRMAGMTVHRLRLRVDESPTGGGESLLAVTVLVDEKEVSADSVSSATGAGIRLACLTPTGLRCCRPAPRGG